MKDTSKNEYTNRLLQHSNKSWKRFLNVQAPYKWNLKRLNLGFTLDVGCGIGRNLINLEGSGIGVDHNPSSIAEARKIGLDAYTEKEFRQKYAGMRLFDSLLLSHVVEHMPFEDSKALIHSYLPFLKPHAKIVLIAPQKMGYSSDPTHVEFFDFSKLIRLNADLQLRVKRCYSFPFPEVFGVFFKYNEFVVVSELNIPGEQSHSRT